MRHVGHLPRIKCFSFDKIAASPEHKYIAQFHITNTVESFRCPAKSCTYDTNTLKRLRPNIVCSGQASCSVVSKTRVKIRKIYCDESYWKLCVGKYDDDTTNWEVMSSFNFISYFQFINHPAVRLF